MFSAPAAATRPYVDNRGVIDGLAAEPRFGRKIWGLLSLELWHQAFHDRAHELRKLAE